MKIGELNQHCGECSLVEYCGEPYDDVMICACTALKNVEEEKYKAFYEEKVDELWEPGVTLETLKEKIEEWACVELGSSTTDLQARG
ncbi:hypothetical protein M2146_001128 [Lachnospiraceae bacterium PF1-22]